MLRSILWTLALMAVTVATARANQPLATDFECSAEVGSVVYDVSLSTEPEGARMLVRAGSDLIAEGPATAYRRGTRYYLPTGVDSGIKLTIDRTPARICFGAGGVDCYLCRSAPQRAYVGITRCPGDGFTLEAYRSEQSYPDIVIRTPRGDVTASGPGTEWGRHSLQFTLPIGPGQAYEAVDDGVGSCTTIGLNDGALPPPIFEEMQCESVGADPVLFVLQHEGDQPFATYFYGRGGYMRGALTALDDGGWLLPGGQDSGVIYRPVSYDLGEICSQSDCMQCVISRPTPTPTASN